jgi:gliding motility-associated-like protein
MSIKIIHKYCCPFIVLFILPYATLAQQCLSRYLSAHYKATNWYIPVKAVATTGKEIVTVGNTRNDHGYITRLSSKASVLFSRQYNPIYQNNTTYFKNLLLNDVINTSDGLQVIAGTVIQDKYIYQSEYINNLGVLFKIDKFGRVLWSKKFESLNGVNNNGFELGITNVMERANGELLVFLSSDYGKNYNAYGKLVCLNKDGQLKWSFLLANGYDGKLSDNRALTETRDHSLVLSEILYKRDLQQPGNPVITRYLHTISINESGEINWEKSFILPTAGSASLVNIKELENGNLALTGNIVTKGIIEPLLLNRAVRIELNSTGNHVRTVSYNFPSENTSIIDVQPLSGGEQVYLLKNDHMAALAGLDPGGNISWQQGLLDPVNNFPATCFTSVGSGYAVFMSDFQSLYSRLLLTAEQGYIPCGNTASFLTIDSFSLEQQTIKTNPKDLDPNRFAISDFPIEDGAFDLSHTIDCRENISCCQNTIDPGMNSIKICEGEHYTLHDGTQVSTPGIFYENYQLPAGCDSIVYYDLKVTKNPSHLSLGEDQCLKSKDSLALIATGGYDTYKWMNQAQATDSVFKVIRPGNYWVNVQNSCGEKTDTITVFEDCNLPVLMPNAFSPGNDGRNDIFRLPPLNKNRFVSLQIFNRWGQLVFSSRDVNKGWDGKLNDQPLPAGVFIYYLQLRGLSGDKMNQKGTILLVR